MTHSGTLIAIIGLALAPLIVLRSANDRHVDHARDVWLRGLASLGACALLVTQPALGLVALAVLVHWRTHEQTWTVAVWAGISATWLVVAALPLHALEPVAAAWRLIAALQVALAVVQALQGRAAGALRGTMAQRSLLAGYLVLVVPFATPWEWPLYALGLSLTCSWLAFLALGAVVLVLAPWAWPALVVSLAVAVVLVAFGPLRRALVDHTPRGGSLDSIRERWRTWAAVVHLMRRWPVWLLGRGPGSRNDGAPRLDVVREAILRGQQLEAGSFHCEPLELAYTYGLLGIAAMAALVWQVAPRLALGDPWSAAVVAGAVLACGTIPCRIVPVGIVWLVALAVVSAR